MANKEKKDRKIDINAIFNQPYSDEVSNITAGMVINGKDELSSPLHQYECHVFWTVETPMCLACWPSLALKSQPLRMGLTSY